MLGSVNFFSLLGTSIEYFITVDPMVEASIPTLGASAEGKKKRKEKNKCMMSFNNANNAQLYIRITEIKIIVQMWDASYNVHKYKSITLVTCKAKRHQLLR